MTWYYVENPKDAARKLLELINEFSKISGHTINIHKSVAFLYANNKLPEREIKETILFTIASKGTQYLRINLATEYDTNWWKDVPCS